MLSVGQCVDLSAREAWGGLILTAQMIVRKEYAGEDIRIVLQREGVVLGVSGAPE